ncbi:MAG: DoxX family protein [Halobacteria archaeon]|nr:DoxX family protein [Halobacteria archaeon]
METSKYIEEYESYLRTYSNNSYLILRIGFGTVIFLAGAHKLIAPGVWSNYAAPWLVGVWPESIISLDLAMVANGVFEMLFGIALIAGFYTPILAGITTLSLLGVVFDLATGALMTGKYVDVLIRDVGLVALGLGVTLESVRYSKEEE